MLQAAREQRQSADRPGARPAPESLTPALLAGSHEEVQLHQQLAAAEAQLARLHAENERLMEWGNELRAAQHRASMAGPSDHHAGNGRQALHWAQMPPQHWGPGPGCRQAHSHGVQAPAQHAQLWGRHQHAASCACGSRAGAAQPSKPGRPSAEAASTSGPVPPAQQQPSALASDQVPHHVCNGSTTMFYRMQPALVQPEANHLHAVCWPMPAPPFAPCQPVTRCKALLCAMSWVRPAPQHLTSHTRRTMQAAAGSQAPAAQEATSATRVAAAVEPAPSQQHMREWMQRIEALAERVAAAQAAGLADDGSTGEADSISTAAHAEPPRLNVAPPAGDVAFCAGLNAWLASGQRVLPAAWHRCVLQSWILCCPEENISSQLHGRCPEFRHWQSSVMKVRGHARLQPFSCHHKPMIETRHYSAAFDCEVQTLCSYQTVEKCLHLDAGPNKIFLQLPEDTHNAKRQLDPRASARATPSQNARLHMLQQRQSKAAKTSQIRNWNQARAEAAVQE